MNTAEQTETTRSFGIPLLVLATAWPLINFAVHNYSFLGFEKSGAWVIPVVFFCVLVSAIAGLAVIRLVLKFEPSSSVRLAVVVVILIFFNYPQLLSFWSFVFNKMNIALAPHYGYATTFLLVPTLILAVAKSEKIEKVVFGFLLLAVVVSLAELFWVMGSYHELSGTSDDAKSSFSGLNISSVLTGANHSNTKYGHGPTEASATNELPNIYHFITDEYARSDQLNINFGFDNSPFISKMEILGFTEFPNARSNYPYTGFSLQSIFSMDYIVTDTMDFQSLKGNFDVSGTDNRAVRSALSLGYSFVFMGSGLWGEGNCKPRDHVICISPEGLAGGKPELTVLDALNRMTPLSYFVSINALTTNITNFEDVKKILAQSNFKPPFVFFAHTLPPHAPYTLKANCEEQPAVQFYLSGGLDSKKYIESLECVNQQIRLLAKYLESDDPDALVVFHSDHGTKFHLEETLPVDQWTKRQFDERYSVLLLTRVPDRCEKYLNKELTLVNLYKFLFSCAAGTEPDYLDDRFYNVNYNVNNVSDLNYGKVYRFPENGPIN